MRQAVKTFTSRTVDHHRAGDRSHRLGIQYTVGGFLAGLQRQGSKLEVLQRARQVGAGKACARVSYSIYCLVEEI
jgi:hypothetical protein